MELGDGEGDIGKVVDVFVSDLVMVIGQWAGLGEEGGEGDFESGEDGFEFGDGELDIVGVDG